MARYERLLPCAVMFLGGCSLFSSKAAEPPDDSALGVRCRVGATDLGPLVTELPAPEKANLEALLQRNSAVAVQFTGCSMRLLPQCELAGNYVWQRTSPSRDVVDIRNEADLFTRLPLGALSLRGELARSGELFVETTVSGQLRLQGFTAAQVPQTPGCLEATHIVLAMSVGAYQMRSVDTLSGGGTVGYAGIAETGGSGRQSTRLLGSSGDAAACSLATAEAAHQNCSSPLQVFLSPIPGRAEPPGPPGSIKVGFVSGDPDARWDVYLDDEATCTTPCDRWVDPSHPVLLRSRLRESLTVRELDATKGPLQVTAYPISQGEFVTGLTFTALGGMAVIAGTAITAIGCSSEDRGGMCTAGLVTLGVGAPITAGAIWLIVDSMPRAEVRPIFKVGGARMLVGPASLSGSF